MVISVEDVARRHEELRAEFSGSGLVGPNLSPIHNEEEGYESFVGAKFKGYRLVHQCFLSLFLETLKRGESAARGLPNDPEWWWYRPLLAFGGNIFTRSRAAEVVFLHGYPLDGYALLRDLRDRAIYLAAALAGTTTLRAILGLDIGDEEREEGGHWEAARRIARQRKKEQRRILNLFVGQAAHLPVPLEEDLRRWGELFDEEVHLSLKSFFYEGGDWMRGLRDLPAGPQKNLSALTMYMNRSAEVAWCITRIMPIFQPTPDAFGHEWARRWNMTEDNLHVLVASVAEEGRRLIASVASWIDLKFPFDPSWSYKGKS